MLTDTSVLNELINQVLSYLECKRNFNREQFRKKSLNLLPCLELHITGHRRYLQVKNFKKKKTHTLGQKPFNISNRTIKAFCHIMKLEKEIVG